MALASMSSPITPVLEMMNMPKKAQSRALKARLALLVHLKPKQRRHLIQLRVKRKAKNLSIQLRARVFQRYLPMKLEQR